MGRPPQSTFLTDYGAFYAIASLVAYYFVVLLKANKHPHKHPSPMRDLKRSHYLENILEEGHARTSIRMELRPFLYLAHIMRERFLLTDTSYVSIEEQLAYFLNALGHHTKNKMIAINFYRSQETVSRHFNLVLRAIGGIRDVFMHQADSDILPEVEQNSLWYPWFKDCIGLVDGTLIPARVPLSVAGRFIGRKPGTQQNILAVATPNKIFTYVLAGWEGSANDFRVLKDALSLPPPHGLKTIEGKYYLVDAGYTTMPGFIAPYRRTRYPVREQYGHTPQNRRELFNLRHSTLRSNIESAFGILKGRFKILAEKPYYPYESQVDIALACFILHNFILQVDPNDYYLLNVAENYVEDNTEVFTHAEGYAGNLPTRVQSRLNKEWVKKRDDMAWEMWKEYCNRLRNGDYTEH